MKTSYKNQIFEVLLNHPLGIDNFEITERGLDFVITYLPYSKVFDYNFRNSDTSFDYFISVATFYSPGFVQGYRYGTQVSFEGALNDFKDWLVHHLEAYINDQETVDLWAEYKNKAAQTPLIIENYQDTTTFTLEEKQTLKLGLNELKLLIAERFTVTPAQLEAVNNRLDYLAEVVERTNKTDYKNILISTIISIMIALSLDASKGQELYNLIVQVLKFAPSLGH